MRPVSQGAPWIVDARVARGAYARRRARRGGAAAGTSRLIGAIGAIVAGGASSRFGGEPKGLHRVGGVRIIDRVAAALAGETDGLLLISNSPNAASWLPHVLTVADARPERGSLVGIHTALTQARATVFVVAWDMPFASRELVRLILDRSAGVEFATVPCGMEGPEPFCAIYTPACVPYIEAAIDAGDLRMSNLLARLPRVTYVPEADVSRLGDPGRLFFNVNDASDLAAAEALLSDRPGRA